MQIVELDRMVGGHQTIPDNWVPATGVTPLLDDDPAVLWLKFHGSQYGFEQDSSPYEFLTFIAKKGRQFEAKWLATMAPGAESICQDARDVHKINNLKRTRELMQADCPVISQPALWWAPERIYGTPDLLVKSSWLAEKFPSTARHMTPGRDHYVIIDLKFTTELDSSRKKSDLEKYSTQVRYYSYIVGNMQRFMPSHAFLVTRDRIDAPLPVPLTSKLEQPLDDDLSDLRERFLHIKLDGNKYTPWTDKIVAASTTNTHDAPWHSAKSTILKEKVPGQDPGLLYYIGQRPKSVLAEHGFTSVKSMLDHDPADIPLEKCPGLGKTRTPQIRAILQANRTGKPIAPTPHLVPAQNKYEFYVDFEYFTNINVDFERQWPSLKGCEMVFMIGAGWIESGKWKYRSFMAASETQEAEFQLWKSFLAFVDAKTGGEYRDPSKCAFYHWTSAEVTQSNRTADRHQLESDHPIRSLPWVDLNRVYLEGLCGVPGAYGVGLKEVAKSLGQFDSRFDPQWPGTLDQGLQAMVMGWYAYQTGDPLASTESTALNDYLEADCRALWKILSWMRTPPELKAVS